MDVTEEFYKAYFGGWQKEHYLKFNSKDYGLTKDNYWDVVLEPSTITDVSFNEIEDKLGLLLPRSFKDFYSSYFTLEKDFDTGGVTIAGNRRGDCLSSLYDYFFEHGLSDDITTLGLLPFGCYNDEWYVCLDINSDRNNPKIVLFEMSNYQAGGDAISHRPWFSDFASMLKCLSDEISTGNWENFDSIDPENNFLTAYDYWER